MNSQLAALSDIDHKIKLVLERDEINTEEISDLVDKREQILQVLLDYAADHREFSDSALWHDAVTNTQVLVEQMKVVTQRFGGELRRYRHGSKSVQQYKKYL
jgi:flagellar rod protein FlaI